jgi:hypothetical protein
MFRIEVVEEIKTFYVFDLFPQNQAVYELMWKNKVQPDRPKTRNQNMEYLLLFYGNNGYANAPVLRYWYTACLIGTIPYVLIDMREPYAPSFPPWRMCELCRPKLRIYCHLTY